MTDTLAPTPPDDSGSDSFERFAYQGFVALPILVACGREDGVVAVYAEHYEDVAVELRSGWRFLQIKTRNAGLGPWRFAHLCADDGALHSLLRTFRAARGVSCTLEVHLEGAVASSDKLLLELVSRDDGYVDAVLPTISERLALDADEAEPFVRAIRVIPNLPDRDVIEDQAIGVLGHLSPGSSHAVLCDVRDRLWAAFARAMRAVPLGARYPTIVLDPSARSQEDEAIVAAKRLTAEQLKSLVAPLTVAAPSLLRRILADGPGPSKLEIKLLAGGADPAIVKDAISLRANASIREFELLGGGLGDEARIADLRERLLITARAQVAIAGPPRPANRAWQGLLATLQTHAATIDPDRLFHADPFLLLGEACELSDQCQLSWAPTV